MLFLSTSNKKVRLPKTASIGRSPSSTLVIDLPSIQPTHLEINTDSMTLLSSGPDVFLNDVSLTPQISHFFAVNDKIRIKSVEFQITSEEHKPGNLTKVGGDEPKMTPNNVITIEEKAIDRNIDDNYHVAGNVFMDTPSLEKIEEKEEELYGNERRVEFDELSGVEEIKREQDGLVTPIFNIDDAESISDEYIKTGIVVEKSVVEETIVEEIFVEEAIVTPKKRGRKKKVAESEPSSSSSPKPIKRRSSVRPKKKKAPKKGKK